jgi:type VI secretion system protein ImpC
VSNVSPVSLLRLDDIFNTLRYTNDELAEQLVENLIEKSLEGSIVWKKNLVYTFEETIRLIDHQISTQLNEVMHQLSFLALEGRWQGLHYLVNNAETGEFLKIAVLNVSKKTLAADLSKAIEFDQSVLFKKIYEEQFGMPGGEPYGLMVMDYHFSQTPMDIKMLYSLSSIAAAAFCPFVGAISPHFFGFDDWRMLAVPRDISKMLDGIEYSEWHQFRQFTDSRFLVLTLPRVLARLPYGEKTLPAESFCYEETQTSLMHNQYCWMNAAYVLAARISHAFSQYGWCTAIRGMASGGKVDRLPLHVFKSDEGDNEIKCPTEIGITDRREAELSALGFLPLCHYKNTNYAVFFGAETVHKPPKYDSTHAMNNARISSKLPYLMATARFAHYLKIMARDKIGAFMQADEIEAWLNRWILNYVNANAQTTENLKAKYPLAAANVVVEPVSGKSGHYNMIIWLKPWLHLEELTASMRLVANIPALNQR